MKAVVRRAGQLVQADLDAPEPGAGQVLAKTLVCGICGSDLHALHHLNHMVDMGRKAGAADTINTRADIVFGHEFCAEILDHGPGCDKTLKPGTRVVTIPYALGPQGMELIGYSNRFPGGFAEQMVLQEGLLLPVPNGLSAEAAALVEPMAVGEHAVVESRIAPGDVALVIGCGPVGLSVIAALKRRGIGPVIASDYAPERRAKAEVMGSDVIVDPASHSPHGHWEAFDVPASLASAGASALSGRAVRQAHVFECVGVPGLLQALIEQAPPKARITVVGVCMEADTITPSLAINKQMSLNFVFAYTGEEFARTLHAIAEGEVDVAPLISGTVGLAGVQGAFDTLAGGGNAIKILVDPSQS